MADLFLIVRIGPHRVAMGAEQLGSVVDVDHVTPVPKVAPHVAGLFALRSRVLTVIDSHVALGEAPMAQVMPMAGVIVSVDGHGYALLVDEVEDVVTEARVDSCTAVLGRAWQRIVVGQLSGPALADASLLLIDPAALIVMPEAHAA